MMQGKPMVFLVGGNPVRVFPLLDVDSPEKVTPVAIIEEVFVADYRVGQPECEEAKNYRGLPYREWLADAARAEIGPVLP